MPTLHHMKTLLYYDGPQVILAQDEHDNRYVGTLVMREREADKYLCAPISVGRLCALLGGTADLLAIYQPPWVNEFLVAVAQHGDLAAMASTRLGLADVKPEWLPGPGLFLVDQDAPVIQSVAAAAREVLLSTTVTEVRCSPLHYSEISRLLQNPLLAYCTASA